jgi:hypothetical protein
MNVSFWSVLDFFFTKGKKKHNNFISSSSVADPDPHAFGPPGSGSNSQIYGSGSFYHHAKIGSKKNLDSYYFVTLFDFLSLKKDVNVCTFKN